MKRLLASVRRPRGQAMMEYSFISHILVLGAVTAGTPMITYLIEGLSKYYESIYWVLTSPIP